MKKTKEVVAALTIHWDRLVLQKQKAGISTTALQAHTRPKLVCVNPNCRQTRHAIENCYWKGGGKEGQFPPNFCNKSKATTPPSSEATATTSSPAAKVATTAEPRPEDATPLITYMLSATLQDNSDGQGQTALVKWTGANSTTVSNIPTYADSGATDHFFVKREAFLDYEELQNPIEGNAAPKGAKFCIVG